LGIEGPPIHYALMRSRAEAEARCREAGLPWLRRGCAIGPDIVVAEAPFLSHEVMHNLLYANGAFGVVALQEGAAEVYGGTLWNEPSVERALSIELLTDIEAFQNGREAYSAAASLVSFLLDVGSEADLIALMSRTSYESDLAQLDAVALDVYGRTMTDLHGEWSARPPEPGSRIARPVFQCSSPGLTLGAEELLHLERGVSESVNRGGVLRTFEVQDDGTLRIVVSAPEASVTVLSCDREPLVMSQRVEGGIAEALVPPGRYAIWLTAAVLDGGVSGLDASVSVSVE
jgi:hypothetical protein